ncbi:glycoside hydrolase family 55 protein [Chytriomyces cf. hyalinus JEL632]|nr:glycoside hydrolase family 55 protein [Chytriomyces cf. hyalinus JEL632]
MKWILALIGATLVHATFWLENIQHQGQPAFNADSSYKVFRNVKEYGVKGDGVTDDTIALNALIASGGRCGKGCDSSTITPAIIYFPPGVYLVSRPIINYYNTFMVGDYNNLPVIKAAPSFAGIAVIDVDPYMDWGFNWFTPQNNFFRQIKNFVIDLTAMPKENNGVGIHWQVSQATSLQNIYFNMVQSASGNTQKGLFIENGSGGFFSNLTFNGGNYGIHCGNQQFTTRELVFNNCNTAIQMLWDWGWVFKSLKINNCQEGINMVGSNTNASAQEVGSVIVLDSVMTNVGVGLVTLYGPNSGPGPSGSLRLDNVNFVNTPVGVKSATGGTYLQGNQLVQAWAQGNVVTGTVTSRVQGAVAPISKPASLMSGSNVFERNKPAYENLKPADILSTKSNGAKGDGRTDDTAAIQSLLNRATPSQLVFFDHGAYVVSNTITVPAGVRIAGEIWPIILAKGAAFQDSNAPVPVFRVGRPGDVGSVEISDLIFETAGPQPGAIMLEWNIKADKQGSAALWDVHARIGGSAGTSLSDDKCAKGTLEFKTCLGPFMLVHITPTGSVYMENTWWWTSDHDLDSATHNQVSIYTGRGMLVESTNAVWLYGTASEHNHLYNYQFMNAANVFAAMFQVETPYYQGVPTALTPITPLAAFNDPTFSNCTPGDKRCIKAWGLRIINTRDMIVYGAGLYSFFENYTQTCLDTHDCQTNMVTVESSIVSLVGLNTIGTSNMIQVDGVVVAKAIPNLMNKIAAGLGFIAINGRPTAVTSAPVPTSTAVQPTSSSIKPTTTVVPSSSAQPSPTKATSTAGPSPTGIAWVTNPDQSFYAPGCDFVGNDIGSQASASDKCGSVCAQNPSCTNYAWSSYNGGTCFMKSGNLTKDKAIVSATAGNLSSFF